MGRQDYLQRLAFGRAAFEVLEDDPLSEADQAALVDGTSQPVGPSNVGTHRQAYNSKGRPCDERSEQLAKVLRDAQNDVLAAVGAVERKTDRVKPEAKPASRSRNSFPDFDFYSHAKLTLRVAVTSWTGTILFRVLAYPYPQIMGIADIILSTYHELGPLQFFLGRLPVQVLAGFAKLIYDQLSRRLNAREWMRRIVIACVQSKTIREFYKNVVDPFAEYLLDISSYVVRDLVFIPISLHSILVSLGLITSGQSSPPISSFNPLSPSSSLGAIRIREGLLSFASDCIQSPFCMSGLILAAGRRFRSAQTPLYFLVWPFRNDPRHSFVSRGPSVDRKRTQFRARSRGFFSALYAHPMRQLYKTFRWNFVSQAELDQLAKDDDAYFAYLSADHYRYQLEQLTRIMPAPEEEYRHETGRILATHCNLRNADDTIPQILILPDRTPNPGSVGTSELPQGDDEVIVHNRRVRVMLPSGEEFRLVRRDYLQEYPEGTVAYAVNTTKPLQRLIIAGISLPLQYWLVRRVLATFVGGPDYRWAPSAGIRVWRPQTASDWLLLASRALWCVGADFVICMGLESLEAGAFVLRHRYRRWAEQRKALE